MRWPMTKNRVVLSISLSRKTYSDIPRLILYIFRSHKAGIHRGRSKSVLETLGVSLQNHKPLVAIATVFQLQFPPNMMTYSSDGLHITLLSRPNNIFYIFTLATRLGGGSRL